MRLGDDPALDLAEAFAARVRRWARPRHAELAARAAAEVSLALSRGHVCLPLDVLSEVTGVSPTTLRADLLASGVAGVPERRAGLPLVLDAGDRLYLHRYFDYECRLARCLKARRGAREEVSEAAAARLRELFQSEAPDWQRVAAALALSRRLTVISGGPGTGKTTTVVNLLACLLRQNPDCRIALAAPTGKAAARMAEALRRGGAHLPPDERERLPREAHTLHRLLGATPEPGVFVHHAGHRLALDVLVVDEASMLDLALAAKLLEAVPDEARVLLLGDKDQLAAVESGAVFAELAADPSLSPRLRGKLADLCGYAPEQLPAPAGAGDSVVWLQRNYRFAADSGIGRLARAINAGESQAALAALGAGGDLSSRSSGRAKNDLAPSGGGSDGFPEPGATLTWIEENAAAPGEATLERIFQGYAAFQASLAANDPAAAFAAFERFRVLCAVREGGRGVLAVNQLLTRRYGPEADAAGWYAGRPVMVLRNDPVLKLFNGDVGIALAAGDGPHSGRFLVHFPDPEGGYRAFAPQRLPEHETAYAMTAHKSQGSEFDEILLLLPREASRVLSRELLYTAITRARVRLAVAGAAEALTRAIGNPTRRHSGLRDRMAE